MNERLYDPDGALSFRSKYLISQALTFAVKVLKGFEESEDLTLAEPSNRADMEELLELFPLYRDLIETKNGANMESSIIDSVGASITERNDNEKS